MLFEQYYQIASHSQKYKKYNTKYMHNSQAQHPTDNEKSNQQSSTYSTHSTQSQSIHTNAQQNNNGIASMLSPRNIMKFFTKNIEQMASPRIASFIAHHSHGHGHDDQPRVASPWNEEQIMREFGKYVESVSQHLSKYKAICAKKQYVHGLQAQKQRQREQLETEIKISKIPEQYFKQSKDQQISHHSETHLIRRESSKSQKSIDIQKVPEHLSTKLQQLLMMGDSQHDLGMNKNKKKSREKRMPLSKKQQELEEYLDQVEIIIYNKTQKYPDRYLHYLTNLNHSDAEVVSLMEKIRRIRQNFGQNIIIVNEKYQRVVKLQKRKKNLEEIANLLKTMRLIKNFKLSSQNLDNKPNQLQQSQKATQSVKTSEVITYIQQYPKIKDLHKIKSIQPTLLNIEQLGMNIKSKTFSQIQKQLHKNLVSTLNSTYSRDAWLKNQLPKDVLMTFRMKPQIQVTIQTEGQDQNMNNSFLNISVLDQSYCVGTHNVSAKNQAGFLTFESKNNKQLKGIVERWKNYCQQYQNATYKLEEQDEQVCEILERSLLKFSTTFHRDLEDYILFIFNQKGLNIKSFPTHKDRVCFIQPKFFNKIAKVFFQALSTSLSYSISFSNLPNTFNKQMSIVQQKINQVVSMRSLTQYSLIQNHVLSYEDVVQLLNVLDYWFQYAGEVSDKIGMFEESAQTQNIAGRMLEFQQALANKKIKIFQQFLANLHKYALVADLKTIIQKSDFSSISIPLSSFIVLDFIINWGQTQADPTLNQNIQLFSNNKINQVDQSFLGASILGDLQNQQNTNVNAKKNKKFSIFKVIDKKLIIQGKQYKICDSLLLLSTYLSIYLKAKIDFSGSAANIDERICQLIGFYIWYSKKMLFSNCGVLQHQSHTPNTNTLQQRGAATMAKSIGGIKTAVNVLSQTYKQYKGGNAPLSKIQGIQQNSQTKDLKTELPIKTDSTPPPIPTNKKTVINLCMLANLCDLLMKFMDVLNITSKPKKVDKVISDLHTIKSDCLKQIGMLPFLQVQQQISTLYESRLKTRKQVPTKQTIKIIQTLQQCRTSLREYYDNANIKKLMENTVKIICKNYFGYLLHMQARGRAELKWFLPKIKQAVGDLYVEEMMNLDRQLRY